MSDFRVYNATSGSWDQLIPKKINPQNEWSHVGTNDTLGVYFGSLFSPKYIAEGTVFTRDISNMPLAHNSAEIAATAPDIFYGFGERTALNTWTYNIPIYVTDSSSPACEYQEIRYMTNRSEPMLNGKVPWPHWAKPAPTGDKSIALYDLHTGIMREYFMILRASDGVWESSSGGWFQTYRNLQGLSELNYAMQMHERTSSAVGMFNPLSQIGIAEAREGRIRHAVSFTCCDALPGWSWPAKGGDGELDPAVYPNMFVEGQWCRFPPDLDLDSLGLQPFTLLIAKAVQEFGAYSADKNHWVHAFNAEAGYNEIQWSGKSPWDSGGDIHKKYGTLSIGDFPWHLTEWAPIDWGKPTPKIKSTA